MTRTSRFPVVAKRRQPEQLRSGPAAILIGSLLVAAALSLQSPAHSTPLDVGTAAEAAAALAATKEHDARIAELEKGFWICDYLSTTRGLEGTYAIGCGVNFEDLKATKFGGDFEKFFAWWRLNKAAQQAALESAGSAQF